MRDSSSATVRRLCLPGIVLYGLLLSPVSVPAQSREYVVLQAPGCQYTTPWGVNESGEVVGNAYGCAGDLEAFAFLYRDGAYSAIDMPGAVRTSTIPTDINDRGVVVGYFRNAHNQLGAFAFWRGEHQMIDVAGMGLVPQGINNRGDITGWLGSTRTKPFCSQRPGNSRSCLRGTCNPCRPGRSTRRASLSEVVVCRVCWFRSCTGMGNPSLEISRALISR